MSVRATWHFRRALQAMQSVRMSSQWAGIWGLGLSTECHIATISFLESKQTHTQTTTKHAFIFTWFGVNLI